MKCFSVGNQTFVCNDDVPVEDNPKLIVHQGLRDLIATNEGALPVPVMNFESPAQRAAKRSAPVVQQVEDEPLDNGEEPLDTPRW